MNYRIMLIAVAFTPGCAAMPALEELTYDEAYDQVMAACERGDFTEITASYVQVEDGSWYFQPCDDCQSRDIAIYWSGNTAQQQTHLLIEEDLNRINDLLGLDGEIPLLTFEQHSQSPASCFYLGDPR